MINNNVFSKRNRRQFISTILPACAFSYASFNNFFTFECLEKKPYEQSEKHKFQKEWGHTYEEAFRWRYRYYIEIMERFADYFGRDKLIQMVMRAVDESSQRSATNDPDFSFVQWTKGGSVYQNMMTSEVIERSDRVFEIRVSECLWAKTFQEKNSADIGYATVCYSDFSSARAAHPKLRLERTKTIMQGHGYCNHRWTWEG